MKIFLIISLILLIPIDVSIADDQAYNYGFLKGIAARPAMDDSSSNETTDCLPMINHIKISGEEKKMTWKRELGYSKYRERIKWLEWDNREKAKRIEELELLVRTK